MFLSEERNEMSQQLSGQWTVREKSVVVRVLITGLGRDRSKQLLSFQGEFSERTLRIPQKVPRRIQMSLAHFVGKLEGSHSQALSLIIRSVIPHNEKVRLKICL